MMSIFLWCGVFLMFTKRSGILSWLFLLEVLVIGFLLLSVFLPFFFVFGLVFSVISATILVCVLVAVLKENSISKTWCFMFY